MAISASTIINVVPRVIQAGSAGLVFNGLLFTLNATIPTNTILSFNDSNEVGAYFGFESEEYNAAVIYFTGYNNSFIKPSQLKMVKRNLSALSAFMRGANNAALTLAELQAVTAGTLSISIDGTSADLVDLDFSSSLSFSDVALIIQSALQATVVGTTVAYSSQFNAFTITSGATGPDSSVSYATGTVAELLRFTAAAGAVLSVGTLAETVAEQLATIISEDQNWVSFTSIFTPSQDEAESAINWSTAQGVEYLYVLHTTDVTATIDGNESDILSQLKLKNLQNFVAVYGSVDVAVAIMGITASIDFERQGGTIDYAFKDVAGLAPSVTDNATKAVLDAKGYNYFGLFATRNATFAQIYKGQIVGTYVNIYTYVNAIWLNNSLQVALMDTMRAVNKLSYTDAGYGYIRATIDGVVDNAVFSNAIVTGVTLSTAQQNALRAELGSNADDAITALTVNGYYLLIVDPSGSARQAGESPDISLYYTDGGSIKKLDVASTVLL